MKKIILSIVTIAVVGAVSLVAAEKDEKRQQLNEDLRQHFKQHYSVVLRVGADALGGDDDTSTIATGKKGNERSMGYEFSIGIEKKVENFEFGTRRIMTIYNYGDATYYNGAYQADITNYGWEMTGATYFKATQYVKPYLGVGLGLNINKYNDHGQSMNTASLQPTVHLVGGVSGELFVGIGFYAEYKYRYGGHRTQQAAVDNGGTFELVEIENKGAVGGQVMAGISYQF